MPFKLGNNGRPSWEPWQIALLRRYYIDRKLHSHLKRVLGDFEPKHTWAAVRKQVSKLDIPRGKKAWSERELNYIKANWQVLTPIEMAEHLPGRTPKRIYRVATLKPGPHHTGMGLPGGPPRGYMSLSAAAEKAGIHVNAFRKAMGRCGKMIRQFNYLRAEDRQRLFVEIDTVDEVAELFVSEETPTEASVRLGVPLLWLVAEMKRAGMHVRKHAPNRHPSKVFDKLAANYVTLEAEAVRLDLRSDTLRNIIRRYVPGRRNNRYALNPGQADDALQLAVAGGFVRRLGYATVTRSRRVANSGGRAHRGAGGVQAVGVSSGP